LHKDFFENVLQDGDFLTVPALEDAPRAAPADVEHFDVPVGSGTVCRIVDSRPQSKKLTYSLDLGGKHDPLLIERWALHAGEDVPMMPPPSIIARFHGDRATIIDAGSLGQLNHCYNHLRTWRTVHQSAIQYHIEYRDPVQVALRGFPCLEDTPMFCLLKQLCALHYSPGRPTAHPHRPTDMPPLKYNAVQSAGNKHYFACLLDLDALRAKGVGELPCNQKHGYYRNLLKFPDPSIVEVDKTEQEYSTQYKAVIGGEPIPLPPPDGFAVDDVLEGDAIEDLPIPPLPHPLPPPPPLALADNGEVVVGRRARPLLPPRPPEPDPVRPVEDGKEEDIVDAEVEELVRGRAVNRRDDIPDTIEGVPIRKSDSADVRGMAVINLTVTCPYGRVGMPHARFS